MQARKAAQIGVRQFLDKLRKLAEILEGSEVVIERQYAVRVFAQVLG